MFTKMDLRWGYNNIRIKEGSVIWVAVGGRGTLVGAALGAFLVNAGKTWFTGMLPEFWLFALGALFILTTLLIPKGIVGAISDLLGLRRKSELPAAPPAPAPAE